MSHRVTTQTEIKDKALAIQALKAGGFSFSEQGTNLTVTSGPMRNATINLSTGLVSGDTDFHSKDDLGALRQAYAEAKYKKECQKQGISVDSRKVITVNGQQVIRLECTAAFG